MEIGEFIVNIDTQYDYTLKICDYDFASLYEQKSNSKLQKTFVNINITDKQNHYQDIFFFFSTL